MPGPMLTVSVDDAQLREALARAVVVLKDTTPIMREIAENMRDASERAFLTNSNPATGVAWKPLSKSRRRQRANEGRSDANILQDTEHLMSTVTGKGAGGIFEVGPGFARVGTNVSYAAAHQFGATIQRKAGSVRLGFKYSKKYKRMLFASPGDKKARYGMKADHGPYTIRIPARPFLGVGQQDIDDMLRVIARRVSATFGRNAV